MVQENSLLNFMLRAETVHLLLHILVNTLSQWCQAWKGPGESRSLPLVYLTILSSRKNYVAIMQCFSTPSPRTHLSPQALGTNKFSAMPSHNNNFINFIQLTFLFIQGL